MSCTHVFVFLTVDTGSSTSSSPSQAAAAAGGVEVHSYDAPMRQSCSHSASDSCFVPGAMFVLQHCESQYMTDAVDPSAGAVAGKWYTSLYMRCKVNLLIFSGQVKHCWSQEESDQARQFQGFLLPVRWKLFHSGDVSCGRGQ